MFQVPSDLLNVEIDADSDFIAVQAQQILREIVESNAKISVCMQHTPLPEQINDLEKIGAPVVLVGGQMMLMYHLIPFLKRAGYVVVEAVTARVVEERVMPDGSVESHRVFKYERMRAY